VPKRRFEVIGYEWQIEEFEEFKKLQEFKEK
jgi:hypothetical protein